MPRPTIITGIDIGSHHIKVLVGEVTRDRGSFMPHIIGRGLSESRGLRHGYIINTPDAARGVRSALTAAEKTAGISVKNVYLAVGGVGLESMISNGSVITSRADSEITDTDVEHAVEAAENAIPIQIALNRKVLHAIPLHYKIDGREVLGKPIGMKGARVEVKVLFITTLEQHLNELIQAIEDAGVGVLDVMASPLAASLTTLNRAQKIAGCVLVNIGAETVSMVVFENNIPISLQVLPVGSANITNDIALGFKVDLDTAESMKKTSDAAFPIVDSKKRVGDIVKARINNIFTLVEAHLKKIGRSGLLPAGIIITGGGSALSHIDIEELARHALSLPARVAVPNIGNVTEGELKDPAWSVAYGLCVWGVNTEAGEAMGIKLARQAKNKLVEWIKQFLP